VVDTGVPFIILIGALFPLQAISFSVAQFVYSFGHTKVGMIATFVANLINLALNSALIFGVPSMGIPSMGLVGVAIGSIVGRVIYFTIIFIFMVGWIGLKPQLKVLNPFPKQVAIDILKVGLPATAENISYSISQLIITGFVAALGTAALISKSYYENIAVLSWMMANAIGGSATIMVGQLTGAADNKGSDNLVKFTTVLAMLTTIVPSVLIVFFVVPLGRVFTDNTEILALMQSVALIDLFLQMGRAVNMVINRTLKATGDTIFPFVAGILEEYLIMIPLGYVLVFVFNLGLQGIWIAIAADEIIRGILMFIRWRSKKWESKSLVKIAEMMKETPPII
jgi:Na+-driven multidrug efflux pump